MLRKAPDLALQEGEEILNSYTASHDVGGSVFSSWRVGNLYLTKKRLLFVQVRKVLFQIPLERIQKMEIVKRRWILGKRVEQLCIWWDSDRIKRVFIAVKNPQKWKETVETLKA